MKRVNGEKTADLLPLQSADWRLWAGWFKAMLGDGGWVALNLTVLSFALLNNSRRAILLNDGMRGRDRETCKSTTRKLPDDSRLVLHCPRGRETWKPDDDWKTGDARTLLLRCAHRRPMVLHGEKRRSQDVRPSS